MTTKLRNAIGTLAAIVAFIYSGWTAFIGLYANLVRIQSAMFPVSGVAIVLSILGLLGASSCIAMFWFPRRAGAVAALAMCGIALTHVYSMAAVYRIEFLRSVFLQLVLPMLLATVSFLIYTLGTEIERTTPDAKDRTPVAE